MVAPAPRSRSVFNTCSLRPAAMTRPALRCLATWTASLPATSVPPRIRTVSHALSCARQTSGSQEDNTGLGKAAAVTLSTPSGIGKHQAPGHHGALCHHPVWSSTSAATYPCAILDDAYTVDATDDW